jgi:hypothetical protein
MVIPWILGQAQDDGRFVFVTGLRVEPAMTPRVLVSCAYVLIIELIDVLNLLDYRSNYTGAYCASAFADCEA